MDTVLKPEIPLQVPRVGADVAFVLDAGPNKGQARPAKVVSIGVAGKVNLQVFIDGGNDGYNGPAGTVWQTSVPYNSAEAPGSWHWPAGH